MKVTIYSDDQIQKLKENIDKELDVLQDRLDYFKSTVIAGKSLKNSYKLNSAKDSFDIDTTLDASLIFLIRQTIRLSIVKQGETI